MSQTSSHSGNRSSWLFLSGLVLAAGLAVGTDGMQQFLLSGDGPQIDYSSALPVQPPRSLSDADRHAAKVAWRYFEKNYQPESGLVDSVSGYPSGTLWDQGSYLFALISARDLGIIDTAQFTRRVEKLLEAMEKIPLFEGVLPNKVYHSRSLKMVDYKNKTTDTGIGWSALDIARMLAALRVLERRYPQFSPRIQAVLANWELGALAFEGRLHGAQHEGGTVVYKQEGRIGYEQYAARAAALWGLDTLNAGSASTIMEWEEVSGIEIPIDQRRAGTFRAITPTLSEPFFMQGLEFGFNRESATLASRVYAAQENRYARTGHITMVSEDNINQEPYFLYSSVYSNGKNWAVVTEKGEHHPELRTISLKAAFAWDALYGTDYTAMARAALKDLETDRGWASGRYETTGEINTVTTANTNAVVLEAIHFIAYGPLWPL
ncbi:DUF3131 domain-containing protein [Roseovarius sp. EL26]|uniref:DUF3131 domain-containing protein n=1 Tax=Roseovarius sp. EL26 TaxID=2126672 RepID=UPI000EA185C0|nr:DUF3131 domain-containing protein [Roseovarius sp. EL26]